ncbi:OmpA family protein [Sneathiella aquimaris]|uniref:OmpA family protein n=1 Tax=Sneathiella aquimaris TaxID=2599305 RepID=UPI00146D07F2|nr:OmpA family protein [Sneathiella aquimaris]
MQCQGRTRTGYRCRNRSLNGELFCDIHMRVNHSHNLTLLIPLLLSALAGYFFFFGLVFNTAIFSIFDINYLTFAGIEDLFLNMLRFGGLTTLSLIILWVGYCTLLFVLFSLLLVYQMIKATMSDALSVTERLKLIGLSIAVFFLNSLVMLVVRFPARNRWHLNSMSERREAFARSLFNLKDKSKPIEIARPVKASRTLFQQFLIFRNLGNHRFFATLVVLFLVTAWTTYNAGSEALYARACALSLSADPSSRQSSPFPFPALILEEDCRMADGNASSVPPEKTDVSLTRQFITGLTRVFHYTPVTLKAIDGQIRLLHLASTARFDLFFNGESGRSLAVPRGALQPLYSDQKNQRPTQSVAIMERNIQRLERQIDQSNKALFGLDQIMKKTSQEIKILSLQRDTLPGHQNDLSISQKNSSIPQHCWETKPEFVIPFVSGSYNVENAGLVESLSRLVSRYKTDREKSLIVTGYADPSGGLALNLRISEKRARSVSQLIEQMGLDKHRLFPVGMGISESSHLPPRRVEIRGCDLN